jgi:phytoene synthase
MRKKLLDLGFEKARRITKDYARTFYLASFFLSPKKRRASYSVYAICRISDEIVDNPNSLSPAKELDKITETINSAYSNSELKDPLLMAFRKTVEDYRIPKEFFYSLLDGMRMDLYKTRYANFEELYSYCYKVAGVIGLIMLKIMDCEERNIAEFALNLAIGIQLTNILRDIKEDLKRGRIYLPLDEMARFGITESDIRNERVNENFKNMARFLISLARKYYNDSIEGIKLIRDHRSRLLVMAIKDMYSEILTVIEKNSFDVFSQRAKVGKLKKAGIILSILFKR